LLASCGVAEAARLAAVVVSFMVAVLEGVRTRSAGTVSDVNVNVKLKAPCPAMCTVPIGQQQVIKRNLFVILVA
jgi:hypothetical protein